MAMRNKKVDSATLKKRMEAAFAEDEDELPKPRNSRRKYKDVTHNGKVVLTREMVQRIAEINLRAPFFNTVDLTEIAKPKQREFLAALSVTGNISMAARIVGIAPNTHATWFNRDKEPFHYREAFGASMQVAAASLEMEARRRAMGEVVKLKLHNGQPIIDPRTGELYLEHAYSDKLLALLLKGADPAKYGNRASSNNAAPEPRGKVVIVLPDNGRGSLDGLETITESELSRRRSELDDRPR